MTHIEIESESAQGKHWDFCTAGTFALGLLWRRTVDIMTL